MQNKILLIGRGLAGAILSLKMIEKGIDHDIIDDPQLSTSSRVAAGLINPIVLKRLKLVAGSKTFYNNIPKDYLKWEQGSATEFISEIPIQHIFHSAGEINDWSSKQSDPDFAEYLGQVSNKAIAHVKAPFGFGIMKNTFRLDTGNFLDFHLKALPPTCTIISEQIEEDDLAHLRKQYHKVIVCNGHLMRMLLPDSEGAFSPTRGEVMTIESKDLELTHILHGPVFILPLGNHLFKVGATYHWDNFKDSPTPVGKKQLVQNLEKIFSGSYTILEHQAGVRPNTTDRKPLVGTLRDNLYCFNGLGSRGALMAPHLADLLIEHIMSSKELPHIYNPHRFKTK